MALTKTLLTTKANTVAGGALTSDAFNSTGYTHLVVFFKYEGGAATTQTPSDNKGSTGWNSETQASHASGEPHGQLHWVKIGTPGSGHTVTMTPGASRSYRAMIVWGVNASTSGELEKDAEAHATGTGFTADAGTLSTSGVSVVSFMGVAEYTTTTWTETGWTEDADGITNGGTTSTLGCSRGPETTTPIDPAATQGVNERWGNCALSLREGAGGGGGGTPAPTLMLMGVGT